MPDLKTVAVTAGIALLVYLVLQLLANYGYDAASILPRPGATTPTTGTGTGV
jgi:hypothetical protein